MNSYALIGSLLIASCLTGTSHAGLNDRTTKLLQSQALNRPPGDVAKKTVPANDDLVRRGQGTGRGIPSNPGTRGAATSNGLTPKQ